MTRETKVGLLAGMAIILLIGIIVSDYLVVPATPVPAQVQQFAQNTQDNIHPPGIVTVPQPLMIPTASKVEDVPTVPTPKELAPPPAPPISQAPPPAFDAPARNPLGSAVVPAPAPQQSMVSRETQELQHRLDDAAKTVGVAGPIPSPGTSMTARTINVEEGDTLYQLAAQHLGSSSRYNELFEANKDQLKAPEALKVGMKLRLPATAVGSGQTSPLPPIGLTSPTSSLTPPTPKPAKTYTVKASDTLYSIAQAQLGSGGRWREIYQINRQALGDDEDALKVGQSLKLPAR